MTGDDIPVIWLDEPVRVEAGEVAGTRINARWVDHPEDGRVHAVLMVGVQVRKFEGSTDTRANPYEDRLAFRFDHPVCAPPGRHWEASAQGGRLRLMHVEGGEDD